MTQLKLGVGICGSFCSMSKLIKVLEELKSQNVDLYLFVTPEVQKVNNRFFRADDLLKRLQSYSGHTIIDSLAEAETFGPFHQLDAMLLMPCSATTLAKLCHGISDNAVLLATKATLRNQRPIIISFYTNDALGNSGVNIMRLLNTKGFYFVPFGQDDYVHKPNSMTSAESLVVPTLNQALEGKQIQPVIISYEAP